MLQVVKQYVCDKSLQVNASQCNIFEKDLAVYDVKFIVKMTKTQKDEKIFSIFFHVKNNF